MVAKGKQPPGGGENGPSAATIRTGLIERVRRIEARNALLAIDAVVSLLEPPYDSEMCVEAFLGVAEMVAGQRLLEHACEERARREEDHEPS